MGHHKAAASEKHLRADGDTVLDPSVCLLRTLRRFHMVSLGLIYCEKF